jgi:hypothetical protein
MPYLPPKTEAPRGPALYIGLPCVLGFLLLVVLGTCIWNRRTRGIGLGNIMGRRRGYGAGKSRAERVLAGATRRRREKKEAIRLMEREVRRPEDRYRDVAGGNKDSAPQLPDGMWDEEVPGRRQPRDVEPAWRDSEALGSLAGTPTEERRMELGSGNAFRDEVRRQQEERTRF